MVGLLAAGGWLARKVAGWLSWLVRPLLVLSAAWALTGAALFALAVFKPGLALSRLQVEAVLLAEAAVIYALNVFVSRLRPPTPLVPFPEPGANPSDVERQAAVIDYCKYAIATYHRVYRYNFQWWRFLLTTSIVLGTVGTVLATFTSANFYLTMARTLAVGLTTIAAGLNTSYRFQQESVRQGAAADALRGELIKFSAKSKPYDDGTAGGVFAANVRAIIAAESQTWVASTQAPDNKGQ